MIRKLLPLAPALLLAGCLTAGPITATHYYAIDPQLSVAQAQPLDKTLGVRPFTVARPYGLAMAFLDTGHRIGYREHLEWAEKPEDMLTRAVTDAIIATGRFSDVGNAAEMARPDFMLTGHLRKFHENRTVAPAQAAIEIRLELREARGAKALWAATLTSEVPLEDDRAATLAAAMSEAAAQIAQHAATAIAQVE